MSCPTCQNNPNSTFCPHLLFGTDGTYLTCANQLFSFEAVDLQPVVTAAETDTDLQLDLSTNSLVYTGERASNGLASSSTIPLSSIAHTINLADLANVGDSAPNPGDLLSFDGGSQTWVPYTIPSGTVVSAAGIDVNGQLVKQNSAPVAPQAAIPIGGLLPWAGITSNIPTGFLLANGAAINRSVYSTLFEIIGTTYGGGDGTTTFNLPQTSGRIPVGMNSGDTEFNAVGKTGGEKTHTLNTSEMPVHKHTINDPGHTHSANRDVAYTDSSSRQTQSGGGNQAFGYGDRSLLNSSSTGISINNSGSSAAHNNLQPYITLLYIIRVI